MPRWFAAPLGIVDTGFYTAPEKADRLATLYFKTGEMPLAPIANPLRKDYVSEPALAMGGAGTCFWIDPANELLFVGMTQFLSYTAPPLQAATQTLLAGAIIA